MAVDALEYDEDENEGEEFEMITKESNKTFHFGKLMQAQVTK